METEYLREFAELANRLSFTEAARALNMTQPTLSKHVRSLESVLGVELVDRSKGRLALTEQGAALLPHILRCVDAQECLVSAARSLHDSAPQRLRVYGISDEVPSTEAVGLLVEMLGDELAPGTLETGSSQGRTPEELLDDGTADLVFDAGSIMSAASESDGGQLARYRTLLLGMLRLVAIVDARHPLATAAGELPLEAVRGFEIIKFEGLYLSRSWCHIEEACARQGFKPKTRLLFCSNVAELLASCSNLGDSVLLIGRNFASKMPRAVASRCKAIPIRKSDVAIPLHFTYRDDNYNPLLREVVSRLETGPLVPFELE